MNVKTFSVGGPALVLGLLGAAGCGASVHTTTMPNVNLSQYRTFSFAQPVNPSGPGAELARAPVGQVIRNDIARDLSSRGIQQVDQNPDFLVAYHTVMQNRLGLEDWGYYGPPEAYEYTQGTIVVDFIDPRTRNVFWRGTASQVVNDPFNPDIDKLNAAVDKLMRKVPTQMASAPAPQHM
jgi:hypothetical protein